MALTRKEVIDKAVELLDEAGLAGLTLRRLAKELGISAPTLYWHVKDKRQLLDLMAEKIMSYGSVRERPMPKGLDWWEIMAEGLRRSYHAAISHRDGALVVAGNRPTDASLPFVERWLGLWMRVGFPPDEALEMVLAAGNYVIGSALEYQAEADRAKLRHDRLPSDKDNKAKYPNLARAFEVRHSRPVDRHSTFEQGLSLFMAGVRARRAQLLGAGGDDADAKKACTDPPPHKQPERLS